MTQAMPEPADSPPETVECEHCSAVVDIDDTFSVGSETWCKSCHDNEAMTCDRCDACVDQNDAGCVARRDGRSRRIEATWCDGCMQRQSMYCSNCGENGVQSESSTVGGSDWCEFCVEDSACSCDRCGDMIAQDDAQSDGNSTYCAGCAPEEDDGTVGDYHSTKKRGFTPIQSPYPYSLRRDIYGRVMAPACFGTELEIESTSSRGSPDEIAEKVADQLGRLFAGAEHDGSLSNGVECISQPATIDYHRTAWAKLNLDGTGARAHDTKTCGFHVHVTRDAFSSLTWAKVVELFGKDEPTWSVVFRRTPNQYARACRKGKVSAGARHDYERYSTVNTANRHTVEFRWPKGTIQGTTVVATIELIHAAIRYCAQASIEALSFAAFRTWICNDAWGRSETKVARAYLAKRGLLVPSQDRSLRPRRTETPTETLSQDGE